MSDIDWRAENVKKQHAVEEAHREIERLRAAYEGASIRVGNMDAEIARLRAALREIAECPRKIPRADGDFDMHWEAAKMHKIAREALGDE